MKLKDYFPSPMVEHPLSWKDPASGIQLTGTLDLASVITDMQQGRVLDWKTGFAEAASYEPQVKAYALLLLKNHGLTDVHVVVLSTRLRSGHAWHYTADELDFWWRQLSVDILEASQPHPGNHCTFCPKWHECPAGRQYVRIAAESLIEIADEQSIADRGALLTNDQLIELSQQRQLVSRACETVQTLLKEEVLSRGGNVQHSDGKRALQITETTQRPILFREGQTILREELGDKLLDCIEVGKTTAKEIVGSMAPPRGKGKAIAAFLERLDEAGALGVKTETKLELKRVK